MKTRVTLVLLLALVAASARAEPIEVAVHTQGERVIVDVTAHVAARREVAWDVLTDYDHMADFVSNLKASVVLSRNDNRLQVEQSGEAKRGFLRFAFSTVRSVELIADREIRSHLVRGDFKSYEFTTGLVGDASGPTTIVHHGEYVPTRWVPPVIGPTLIETETRKQYAELIAEMLKREATEPPSPR